MDATSLRRSAAGLICAASLALGAGCRQDMHDQPRYEPLEASAFFSDGRASRPGVPGTIHRGGLREDEAFFTGRAAGAFTRTLPVEVTREILNRGRERYDIFCAPCHDRLGTGRGMVIRRGFPEAASFHIDRLRAVEPGYFFDVITNGFGRMPDYRSQIRPADRWAIVAYIRALQLSRNAAIGDVPAGERSRLGSPSGGGAP